MVGARACAAWKTHARQEVDAVQRALVRCDPRIAVVIVAVRPHAIGSGGVSGPSEVTHGPEAWPESFDVAVAWKRHARFQPAAFEAELVPALNHCGPILQAVGVKVVEL